MKKQKTTIVEYFLSEKKKTEFAIWAAGIFLGVAAVIFLLLFYLKPFFLKDFQYQCWVRSHSGLLCPGCGGTRACLYFAQGKFLHSFYFHPVVPYLGVIYIVYMLRGILHFCSKGKFPFMRFRLGYIYIAIGIILLQFFIKNYLLLRYGFVWI